MDYEEIKGALNDYADVPPTDSPSESVTRDDGSLLSMPEPADAARVSDKVDWALKDPTPEEEAAVVAAKPHEDSIPYEKWKGDHDRLKHLEHEAQQLRHERELIGDAAKAGYGNNLEEYQRDNELARTNGYGSIEAYRDLVHYSRNLQQRNDLTDHAKTELLRAHQRNLHSEAMLREAHGLLRSVSNQTLGQQIASTRAQFEDISDEHWKPIEGLLRQMKPEGVRKVAEAFAPLLKTTTKAAEQKAVAGYIEKKAAAAASATPEGRGGNPPPVTGSSNWRDNVGKAWSVLFNEAGRTG